jgi:hypothetical protein
MINYSMNDQLQYDEYHAVSFKFRLLPETTFPFYFFMEFCWNIFGKYLMYYWHFSFLIFINLGYRNVLRKIIDICKVIFSNYRYHCIFSEKKRITVALVNQVVLS